MRERGKWTVLGRERDEHGETTTWVVEPGEEADDGQDQDEEED